MGNKYVSVRRGKIRCLVVQLKVPDSATAVIPKRKQCPPMISSYFYMEVDCPIYPINVKTNRAPFIVSPTCNFCRDSTFLLSVQYSTVLVLRKISEYSGT